MKFPFRTSTCRVYIPVVIQGGGATHANMDSPLPVALLVVAALSGAFAQKFDGEELCECITTWTAAVYRGSDLNISTRTHTHTRAPPQEWCGLLLMDATKRT